MGSKEISFASDIFSLGIIFYSMVTGVFPFKGEDESVVYSIREDVVQSPVEIKEDLPADLNKLLLGMLEKESKKRPTALQVLVTLQNL